MLLTLEEITVSRAIMLVGDLHFKAKNLADVSGAWTRLVEAAASKGVPVIFQAGDVFHHSNVYGREASTGTVYDAFMAPFRKLEKAPKLVVSIGNHDQGSPLDKDALAPIDKYDWIKVIRQTQAIEMFDDLLVFVLPWINKANLICSAVLGGLSRDEALADVKAKLYNSLEQGKKAISEAKQRGKLTIVLGHVEVEGCAIGHGMTLPDGGFSLTPAQIVSLGADMYAMGHVHIHQRLPGSPRENDGYLGTLCQNSHKEEGNFVGCRYVEYEGRNILIDKMIENRASPKYFTVYSMDKKTWRDSDYVKYRGDEKPDGLPQNVVFERVPKQVEPRQQAENLVEADDSLEKLLEAWAKAAKQGIDAKSLSIIAEELTKKSKMPSDSIGSLERIERIMLENVACHEKTEIDLAGLNGLCAVEGPNGSGKTSAMEAIVFSLYGECPSRPKLDMLATRGKDSAAFELDFISSGKKLRVRRDVKTTTKFAAQKAIIVNQDTGKPEAGPGSDDVFHYCERVVGNQDLVMSGIFSSQNEAGNIIDLKPAERKALFAKLLGTEKFLFLAATAKKIADSTSLSMEAKKERDKALEQSLSAEGPEKDKLSELEEALIQDRGTQVDLASRRKTFSEAKAVLDVISTKRGLKQQEIEGLKASRAKVIESGKEIKSKMASLGEAALDKVKQQKADMDEALKKRDELKATLSAQAVQHANDLSAASLELLNAEKMRAALAGKYDKYVQEFKDKLAVMRWKASKVETERRAIFAEAESCLNLKKKDLEHAEKGAGLLAGFPDVKECLDCPLAKNGMESRKSIPDLKRETSEISSKTETLREEFGKFLQLVKEKLESVEASMTESKDFAPDDKEEIRKAVEKAVSLQAVAERSNPSDELKDGILKLDDALKDKDKVYAEFEKASSAKEMIAKLEGQLERLRSEVKGIDEKMAAEVASLPKDTSAELEDCVKQIDNLDSLDRKLASRIDGILVEVGKSKQLIESFSLMRTELKALQEEVQAEEKVEADHLVLAKAFGRDGIPQMIFESAVPHFQGLLNDIMQEFDNKWAIQVVSQKETKSGTVHEHIDILVDDGMGEREISGYSGGERKLLKNLVRVAFSVMQAQRSGKGLKVLVLDEATDAMDESNAEAFIRVLNRLKGFFNQVFIVSHNDRMLASIPSRIRFEKTGLTTRAIVAIMPS